MGRLSAIKVQLKLDLLRVHIASNFIEKYGTDTG